MCLQPKHASSGGRINACLVPPRSLVTAAMHLTVMSPAQRNRIFVADLAAKCRRLHKAQMVSIGGPTTAESANPFGGTAGHCGWRGMSLDGECRGTPLLPAAASHGGSHGPG